MTFSRILAWMGTSLVIAGAPACGARVDDAETVAAGTTGTGGNGGAGGGGGGSGGTSECGPLTPVGEAVVVEVPPNMAAHWPKLAHSGGINKQSRAVLGLVEIPVEGPMGILAEAHTLGLEPWGTWPPASLASSAMLGNVQGAFAIAQGTFVDLGALYRTPAFDVLYSPALTAGQAPGPDAPLQVSMNGEPLFLAQQGPGHVFGFGTPYTLPAGESAEELVVGLAGPGPSGVAMQWMVPLGCARDFMVADAESVATGALVAFGSGNESLDLSGCAGGLDPVGFAWPDRLVVAKVGGNPPTATLGAVDDGISQVDAIAMAGRSDGAWVVFGRNALQGDPGAIYAARLDADGNFAAGPWKLAQGSELYTGSISADRLGDDLVVAWAGAYGVPTRIEVRRLDGTGAEVAAASFEVEDSVREPVAVLGSPAGNQVLLAYPQQPAAEMSAKVHLRRLGCAD